MRPTESFERKNVTEMGLDLPSDKPEARFDPKHDITSADWQGLRQELDTLLHEEKNRQSYNYMVRLSEILDIDPGFDPQLPPGETRHLHQDIDDLRQKNNWVVLAMMAPAIHELFPTEKIQVGASARDIVQSIFTQKRKEENWATFARWAEAMRRLDPSLDLAIGDLDVNAMNQALIRSRQGGEWIPFMEVAVCLSHLDPPVDAHIQDQDWADMREDLDFFRRLEQWSSFAMLAALMSRFARTEKPPQSVQPANVPPMPETKSYYE